MMDNSHSRAKNARTSHADSTNETVEAGEVPCGAHTIKQPPVATPTASPGGVNGLTATLTLLRPDLRAYRESAAPTIFRKRTTSRNAPTSPSQRRRYIPRRQLLRSKATRRRPGHSVYCQHRVLGHLRNEPNPLSLLEVRKSRTSPTCTGERTVRANRSTAWPRWSQNRPRSKRHRNCFLLPGGFRRLRGLEDPTFDFSDNSLDDNYTSREDMIQDVQDYTSVLDFDANDPAELLVPMQASPGGSSPGGVTPQGSPSSSASVPAPTLETAPAPAPVPAAQQATATGTNRYAMQPGVTRAVTRSQVRSPVATDDRANRNNRAAVAGLFQKDTLQQVHKLESHANLDIANQLDDTFSTEYAYATTNA